MAKFARPEAEEEAGQAESPVRGEVQSDHQAVDAGAEGGQRLAGSTPADLSQHNQSWAELLAHQARHNVQFFRDLARPTNWGRAAELQNEYLRTSWQRALQFGRRYVEVSQAVMTSPSSERPVEDTVALREEVVEVAHRWADRKLKPEEAKTAVQGKTVEMIGTGEQHELRNEARVTGEAVLGKRAADHDETVTYTVHKPSGRASSRQELRRSPGHARAAGFSVQETTMAVRAVMAKLSPSTLGWRRIGTVLAAAAAALAAAALYNRYRTRQIERRHLPSGRFVEVDGIQLPYLERGMGPPVVLLHGNMVAGRTGS